MTAGTKRLSEVARYLARPEGIVDTDFRRVAPRLRAMGVEFDEWQRGAGKLILSTTKDGKYAATVGGVGISICRQSGKTYTVGGLIFALSSLTPNMLTLWTSHHMATTGMTFEALQGFADQPKVKPYVEQIYYGSGDEAILFTNKSKILFGARERGFGRGMSDVDNIVFDEAQILTDRAMDNMLASMNTASNPLAFFMGTPPRPEDASEVFTRMRQECLDGEVTDSVWIECGAEEDCDPSDRRQWSIANPSFPHRTPVTAMKRLQRKLQPDSWMREGLGVWRKQDMAVFDLRKWAGLAKYDVAQPERVILTIAVAPDRSWSSIGVAGNCVVNGVAKTMVMCHSARGMSWVASKVEELQKVRRIDKVAIIGGQAKSIRTDLSKAGIEYDTISQVDEGAACGAFLQAHKNDAVVHVGQPELDVAVANARTRRTASGEIEIWDSAKTSVDISPLRACAAAFYLWGLNTPIGIY